MKKRAIFTAAALAFATLAGGVLPASAAPSVQTLYDTLPPAGTPNIVSEAYQATQMSEFGDAINLGGSARKLNAVTVTMSSWACQAGTWQSGCYSAKNAKFSVPITLNIYGAPVAQQDGTVVPGDLLVRVTKTFQIPYRPTASLRYCQGDDAGKWYSNISHTCSNGKLANVTYNFSSLGNITLPDTVVLGVSINTSDWGPHPLGHTNPCNSTPQGCPYDSLNLGLNAAASPVGAQYTPGTVFQNTATPGDLCDSTPATNEFNQDSPTNACWIGTDSDGPYTEIPAFEVTAH